MRPGLCPDASRRRQGSGCRCSEPGEKRCGVVAGSFTGARAGHGGPQVAVEATGVADTAQSTCCTVTRAKQSEQSCSTSLRRPESRLGKPLRPWVRRAGCPEGAMATVVRQVQQAHVPGMTAPHPHGRRWPGCASCSPLPLCRSRPPPPPGRDGNTCAQEEGLQE